MEAASPPPLQGLPELELEEPLDSPRLRPEPATAAGAAPTRAAAAAPKDAAQTSLNYVDPEMFLAPGQAATAVPVVNASEQSAKAPEPALELVLEDPVVDERLTAPPPPTPPPVAVQ